MAGGGPKPMPQGNATLTQVPPPAKRVGNGR